MKIHIQSGKLSLMTYDDFAGKPLPRLLERVKVDMRAQRVVFFDYGPEEKVQLLYGKAQMMTPEMDRYEEQARFDAALRATGIDLSGFGPDGAALAEELKERGLVVKGWRLMRGSGHPRRTGET
ncbi:MAG: hypothetical protein QM820_30190 [Minicystis sp.]